MFRLLLVFSFVCFAFSVFNTSSFGIPMYWIMGSLALVFSPLKVPKITFYLFLLYLLTLLVLFVVHPTEQQLKQTISRSMFFVSGLGAMVFIHKDSISQKKFVQELIILLAVFFAYGIYEMCAKILGLPLFLNFLANNVSFKIAPSQSSSGWIGFFQSRSIWPEPSSSVFPILIYLIVLFFRKEYRFKLWWFIPVLYGVLTFSRSVWVVTICLLLLWGIFGFLSRLNIGSFNVLRFFLKTRIMNWLLFITLLTANMWPFIVGIIYNDLSTVGRSSSVIVGARIFSEYPLFGTGFNTYELFEPSFSYGLSNYHREGLSLNVFTFYLQQCGLLGLLLIAIPLIIIYFELSIPVQFRLIFVFAILFAGSLVGDIYYYGIVWISVALINCLNSFYTHERKVA